MRTLAHLLVATLLFTLGASLAAFLNSPWLRVDLLIVAVAHGARASEAWRALMLAFASSMLFAAFHHAPPILFALEACLSLLALRIIGRFFNLDNPLFLPILLMGLSGAAQVLMHAVHTSFLGAVVQNPITFGNSLGLILGTGLFGPILLSLWRRAEERLFGSGLREVFILR